MKIEKKRPKTIYVGVRLFEKQASALAKFCESQEITVSDLLRAYVNDILAKKTDYKPEMIDVLSNKR